MRIPAPASGGLILSYRCPAECRHCMYGCSPRWSADWIGNGDLETILAQLSRTIQPSPFGPRAVSLSHGLHFTGGEPFLNFELLCKAVEMAGAMGIPSTFVETNGAWCATDRVTLDKLGLLREKGLTGIMISVNPFYLEFVPFERTERAVRCALATFAENVMVYQVEYYRRFTDLELRGTLRLEEYLRLEGITGFIRNVEFFMMGRAPYSLGGMLRVAFPPLPAGRLLDEPCQPPFVRDWHNHFDNYGNYVPGFCGGISYGDCRNLDELIARPLTPGERPVLDMLMREDLRGLLGLAGGMGYVESEGGYLSRCHLCVDIRKHLASTGRFAELAPAEFYDHIAQEGREPAGR